MRDSLSLLDQVISFCGEQVDDQEARQVLGIAGRAQLANMFTAMKTRDGQQILELLNQQHQQGTDLEKYAHRYVDFVRDLLVVRVCPDPSRLLDQQADELSRMSELVEDLQPADLHRMLGTLLRHIDELARSVFPRLRLEMALLEICEQGPTLPIAELLDAVQNARALPMGDSKKKTVAVESPTRESARTVVSQSSSQVATKATSLIHRVGASRMKVRVCCTCSLQTYQHLLPSSAEKPSTLSPTQTGGQSVEKEPDAFPLPAAAPSVKKVPDASPPPACTVLKKEPESKKERLGRVSRKDPRSGQAA